MRIGVYGAAGRMGRTLVRAICEREDLILAAAVDRDAAGGTDTDAGTLAAVGPVGVNLSSDPQAFADCEAVVDFTTPDASLALSPVLADLGVTHIVGTTGFSKAQDEAIGKAAERIVIVKSGNMSLGVNLLAALVEKAASALPDADIEVVEMHHRSKVDAPSGTALLLGEAAARGRGVDFSAEAVLSREGQTGARRAGAIGFAALRGGTVVGEHELILALDNERITLGHIAEDRSLFANGALHAATWSKGRPPGLYTMREVLGL